MIRIRAIYYSLKFGFLPWWLYESACHYRGMSYLEHLQLNINYALVWASRKETKQDYEFERDVNLNF